MDDIIETVKELNVLYIEDHEETNEVTSRLFSKLFKNVYSAKSYEEAKQYFDKPIDLLITDISLPIKNGIEIADELKKKKPEIKVIFISAHNDTQYLLKAIEIGADAFLFKPFSLEKFMEVLTKIVKIYVIEKENEEFKNRLIDLVEEKNKKLLVDEISTLGNFVKLEVDLEKISSDDLFVVLVDIRNFKNINSAYGFEFGNAILRKVGETLKEFGKHVYRVSSDQFVLIFEDPDDVFDKIKNRLDKFVVHFNDFPVYVFFTIVSFFAPKEKLKDYITIGIEYIKEHDISTIFIDEGKIQKLSQKSKDLTVTLKYIKDEKIYPYFQPIIDLKTKKVAKYEVLARIVTKDRVLTPFAFISDLKKAKLVNEITKQIIDKSFKYAKNHHLSINITNLDLVDKTFIPYLESKVKEFGISPSNITFEILEDISLKNEEEMIKNINILKSKGFLIALDDFGIGYSNFERLMKISPDYIKIDGKFIQNLDTDENSYKITKAINILSHSVGAKTIAEFVENEEIEKKLIELGIDYGQGYYYAPPLKEIE